MKVLDKQGNVREVKDIASVTQVPYIPHLVFDSFWTLKKVVQANRHLQTKGAFSPEQLWLGNYFQKEVLDPSQPLISLRWINEEIGWGIFAEQHFPEMHFIAEYAGVFRRRKKADVTNAYCFECPFVQGTTSPYLIDAASQGGIARYINHSEQPNLTSALATVQGIPHILLYTLKPIKKGEELLYDYGATYWKKRKKTVAW